MIGSRHQPQISRTAKPSALHFITLTSSESTAVSTTELARIAKPILTLLSIILACRFHTHFGGTHFVSHPLHVYLSLNVYLSIIHSFGCVSVSRGNQAWDSHSSFPCVLCEGGTNSGMRS
ncbi:hypothetical protein V8G54_036156 [Vigna mungo]|uniref:Uncharacterized protein n=1 Tax=Vigna mungo TaxID=3915 RepID=A0AAQ3RFB8_VIGMU